LFLKFFILALPIVSKAWAVAPPPEKLRVAVKYVAFQNSQEQPVISDNDTTAVFKTVNSIWEKCSIEFKLERFSQIEPKTLETDFNISRHSELPELREALCEQDTLLVVTTGTWNRTGSLGKTTANAWTAMPKRAPFGIVLEAPVARHPNLLAHEFGHYLNLNHAQGDTQLMNPTIYRRSNGLTPEECNQARSTVLTKWARMLR
jgi:hypothetical protein